MKLRRVEVTDLGGGKREALFHQFGLDTLEFSDGGGVSLTVAIVEFHGGEVAPIPLPCIRFLDSPEALA